MNKHVLYQEVASTTTRTNSKAQRAFIVCIALIMSVFITDRANAQTVTSFVELQNAIAAYGGASDDVTITVNASFNFY